MDPETEVERQDDAELETQETLDEGTPDAPLDEEAATGGEEQVAEGEEQGEPEPEAPKPRKESKRYHERRQYRRLQTERDYLLAQNQQIINRMAVVETTALASWLSTVDSQLSECQNDADTAERLELEALQGNDNESVRTARRIREQATNKAAVLRADKERISRALEQAKQSRPPAPPPQVTGADEETSRLLKDFQANKPWLKFNEQGLPANAETSVVWALDQQLVHEGQLDTDDPEYWQELNKRVRSALPRLFGDEPEEGGDEDDDLQQLDTSQNGTQRQGSPRRAAAPAGQRQGQAPRAAGRRGPAVGSSTRQGNAGQGRPRLAPERIAAIKELGEWNDPKKRQEWVDYYAAYDKEHGVSD